MTSVTITHQMVLLLWFDRKEGRSKGRKMFQKRMEIERESREVKWRSFQCTLYYTSYTSNILLICWLMEHYNRVSISSIHYKKAPFIFLSNCRLTLIDMSWIPLIVLTLIAKWSYAWSCRRNACYSTEKAYLHSNQSDPTYINLTIFIQFSPKFNSSLQRVALREIIHIFIMHVAFTKIYERIKCSWVQRE